MKVHIKPIVLLSCVSEYAAPRVLGPPSHADPQNTRPLQLMIGYCYKVV